MVKKKNLPIRWDGLAKKHLDSIFEFIAKDSTTAARKVKKELIKLAHSLDDFPKKYSIEEFLTDESKNYRSVSKWNYKIIYEITDDCLIIVDVFQTSQHPSKMISEAEE
ncbi:MAG: type II toxin-antitoxin system RelE/ParE family toxin [Bacteroidales bacterium]|nr:type II toxin-antitoxin system RelE/ParE family toxin [Bacteroidales bacterium]NCU35784.1 type II toxin-antitoxin system RelE/ParE family toxin [Candidatus Falkowbacteria bacterium]MDD2631952.1 type II toxin-antitoxin system RelE/ParE family toxin [Bacteroidales bacterium]MDD3130424.1 type II toxin-antitoxin system RelE/ParE family toxin [Bacteroidales bacterium]MDD3527251.1 type II toxin-antitoxin system RelE/ParE family toxin [Bacteroidales bacterium]